MHYSLFIEYRISLGGCPHQYHVLHTRLVCSFESYLRPCLAHAGHIGTDRSLLTGHNALLVTGPHGDLLLVATYVYLLYILHWECLFRFLHVVFVF